MADRTESNERRSGFDQVFHRAHDLVARRGLDGLQLSERAAISPDGRALWAASESGALVRVDVRRVAVHAAWRAQGLFEQVAHLPWCDAVLAVAGGALQLLDAQTLRPLTARGASPGALWGEVAVSSSARRLALEPVDANGDGARSGRAEVWEVARLSDDPTAVAWRRVAELPVGGPLRLSADGSVLAGVSERIACAFDIARGARRWISSLERVAGDTWALTPDGEALLVASARQGRTHLSRVDGRTGREVWSYPAPDDFAGMTLLREGAGVVRLYGASIDYRAVGDGLRVRAVSVQPPPGVTLCWCAGQHDAPAAPLIAASEGALYEVCPERGEVATPALPAISLLEVSPDGRRLAGADAEGCVAIWQLDEPRTPRLTSLPEAAVALTWSSDGRHIAVVSARRVTWVEVEFGRNASSSLDELEFPADAVVREVAFAAADRAIVLRVSSGGVDGVCVLAREGLDLRWHGDLPSGSSALVLDTARAAIWAPSDASRWRDVWTGCELEGELQARAQRLASRDAVLIPGDPEWALRRGGDGRWYADGDQAPRAGQDAAPYSVVAVCPRGERVFAGCADGAVVVFARGAAPAPPPPKPSPAPVVQPSVTPPKFTPRVQTPLPTLERIGHDLTASAARGGFPAFVGREEEVQRVIEVLCRRTKRNPVLLGPAGVGKTAIVEELASRIARGEVPAFLQGTRVFSIQPQTLANDFERVVAEASQPGIVLFVDEVHAIVGTGGAEGRNDVATKFKPALSRGAISVIAATTDNEYRRFIEADGALERRFAPVRVHALSPTATLEVLRALRVELERLRGVVVADEVLERLVSMAQRYMRNRHFPDKAVDLLEQCVAAAVANGRSDVSLADAVAVVQRFVDVPLDLDARLPEIAQRLRAGALLEQDAIEQLHERLRVTTRGVDARPERANAVLLLRGEAATTAKALSEELAATLFGSAERVIDIDVGGFVHPSDVNRLIGAPPAYVGFDRALPLHRLAQTPWCVLLLQNVHGCHPQVLEVITEALSKGAFTDSRGQNLPVADAIVVLTARGLRASSRRAVGFGAATVDREDDVDPSLRELSDGLADLCDVVAQRAPTRDEASSIGAEAILTEAARRYAEHGLELRWDSAVAARVLDGARGGGRASLERFMDREIAPLLLPWIPRPDEPPRRVMLRVESGSIVATEG